MALLSYIKDAAKRMPDHIALESPTGTLRYAAMWERVQQLGAWLTELDARVIALDLPDDESWVIAHLACLYGGIPQLPLPPFFTQQQREHAMRDAGADYMLAPARTELPLQWRGDSIALSVSALVHAPVRLPEPTALITYTSGSTGTPKGVCLSADGMLRVAESLRQVLGAELAQRHLSVLPMAVLLEQVGGLYATLISGGTYVFAGIQKHPHLLAEALETHQASSAILVPELLKLLVHSCMQSVRTFSTLQFIAVGGARVPQALLDQSTRLGLPVYQGYGLTESASVVAVNTPGNHRPGTVGTPLPHIQYTLAADGEIILHNPALLGYTGAETFHGDYATGDLGSVDAGGFLTIHGRKKNVLITAYGRNISPEWPESLLLSQPEIAQALVYGDAESALSAVIVPASPEANVAAAIARVNVELPEYARIGAWQASAPFTPTNGMLTGTGRVRREVVLNSIHHQKEEDHEFLRPISA